MFPKKGMNMSTPFNADINKIKTILNVTGSPFNKPQNMGLERYNAHELYKIAQKNKIGLLFLQSLDRKHFIGELKDELNKQTQSYNYLLGTAVRAAIILNSIHCKYAVIKSIMPFPAVPGDIDILVFGDGKEYDNAIQSLKANYFENWGEKWGVHVPHEEVLHDIQRGNRHTDPTIKDPFDVDMYRVIGASYIIYMDKAKLINQISEVTINSTKVSTLKNPGELAVSIFHSIFPERIYTLLLHFYILHTIDKMSSADVDEFLRICHDHKMANAALSTISLSETIQEICFDEAPPKITSIREALGRKKSTEIYSVPYRYPLKVILNSFWHKKSDLVFSKSVARQTIITLLSPKIRSRVFSEYSIRSKRDTY
jgi:hypothetical protein